VDVFAAAALVITVLLLLRPTTNTGFDPSRLFAGITAYRAAGWPSGVQEDDDARWSWARGVGDRPAAPEIADVSTAEAVEPREAAETGLGILPEVTGGRYEVRATVRGQVRPADRARS
jgi:hypothetical protein